MKAIVQKRYGSSDVLLLSDIDKPTVGDDDVLVRVHAADVQTADWHIMTGRPYLIRMMGFGFRAPKARVRGIDVAGRVEAVGKNVTEFSPGDLVFGACNGSFAEYVCARENRLAPKPTNLSFEQAATIPVSATSALQGLRDAGQVQAGQKVLVIGAAGGVGLFAVQLAKAFGAHVTGVCSTARIELVRSIGADDVIDYTQDDFTDGSRRFDLILDTAGNRSLWRLRRALTPKGTLVIVGGEKGGRLLGGIGRSLLAIMLSPFTSQNLRGLMAVQRKEDLQFLTKLIEAGKVTPVIDRTYSLSEVPEAIRQLEKGHPNGKIVITV